MKDPIKRYRNHLLANKIITEEVDEELKENIKQGIAVAFDFAKNSPFPDPETAFNHLYA